jgi:ribosomal protein S18 acetylase RimI-like enzyme
MNLRPATPEDAAPLAWLGAHAFTAKFGDLYRPEDLKVFLTDYHTVEKVAKEIADPAMRIMVAEGEDGALLGFCKLVMACGWPEHARGSNVIELKQLYTHPEVIGKGIGGKLTAWAVDEALAFGADEIQLSVYAENPDAHRFYARHGFEKVADIHFMVGEQRDEEFLYARMLDPAA